MIDIRKITRKENAHKNLLSLIRDEHYPNAFELTYEKQNLLYWADDPNGGVGVSFIDLEMCEEDFLQSDFNKVGFVLNDDEYFPPNFDRIKSFLPPREDNILYVSDDSIQELGRKMTTYKHNAFNGFDEHWYKAYDICGNPVDDVMLFWETHREKNERFDYEGLPMTFDDDNEEIEHIGNDFTCRPFNYLYLRQIYHNRNLTSNLDKYKFFTDGDAVDSHFAYYSPAYALALMLSLKRHNLLDVALHDYRAFMRYHPADPLVRWSQGQTTDKYNGISLGELSMITKSPDSSQRMSYMKSILSIKERMDNADPYSDEFDRLEKSLKKLNATVY